MLDELKLIIGDREMSGWTDLRVTRGIERCPSDFELGLTELYPGDASAFVIEAGDTCQVLIGKDLVITGYVDRFIPSFSEGQHSIRVVGRSKCADLVDCSAQWPGGQISGSSVLGVAQKLAHPYGITVSATADVGLPIPQFNLNLGEPPFDIIERMCRYSALLAYDDTDGNLVLSRVGTKQAASGFTQGENVQSASIAYSMDQRFFEYEAFIQSMDVLSDLGDLGNLVASAIDDNVRRCRNRIIIAESGDSDFTVAKKRVEWEAVRRFGRSNQLHLTTDSWRDKDGQLWAPNTLVRVSLPRLKLQDANWIISEVTYSRNEESGTTADLVIMPPEAFYPQPTVFQPAPADVPANPGAGR
ncbi:phage baseplate assembly protein [Collimonas silvisoli]|uniref:phage baseplate assembly protein n=1 Tax=Collimonas silvisoli TaxID=2825884 RepID=UPI001B8D0861|nr:Mu P family protein [Collimonas silvisoli]